MSERMTLNELLFQGGLVAAQSILAATLAYIGREHGEGAVRAIRIHADALTEQAVQRRSSDDKDFEDQDETKEMSSCAEGFTDRVFKEAFDAIDRSRGPK